MFYQCLCMGFNMEYRYILLGTLDYACSCVIWFIRMNMELFRFYSKMGILLRWMFIFHRARWVGFFNTVTESYVRKLDGGNQCCVKIRFGCVRYLHKNVRRKWSLETKLKEYTYTMTIIVEYVNFVMTKKPKQNKPNASYRRMPHFSGQENDVVTYVYSVWLNVQR